jgi:hypothetical protein
MVEDSYAGDDGVVCCVAEGIIEEGVKGRRERGCSIGKKKWPGRQNKWSWQM